MTGEIIKTNLVLGGELKTDEGEWVKFRWADSTLDPSACGHGSRIEFAYIETRNGKPYAVGVRPARNK